MGKRTLTRRRFGLGAGSVAALGLAGCLGDDGGDDNGEDDGEDNGDDDSDWENDTEGQIDFENGTLTIKLEDENGDPVTQDVKVTLESEDGQRYVFYQDDGGNSLFADNGEYAENSVIYDEYNVTVESPDGTYESFETQFTMEEEDAELVLTLTEASGDDGNETEE